LLQSLKSVNYATYAMLFQNNVLYCTSFMYSLVTSRSQNVPSAPVTKPTVPIFHPSL